MTDQASLTPNAAHEAVAAQSLRVSRGRWRIASFIALALLILVGIARFAVPSQGDYVARVVIDGMITTDAARQQVLKDLATNDRVKGVIVAINSPGGTTAGGEELYEALNVLREAKPTVAVINELGASAAYMTAIGTERIFARRLSIVGSIGVLFQHMNAGKLMDTIGVDLDKVASGPLKAEPDVNEPLEGAARASISALVDNSFQWFVDIVAERRQLDRPTALALADGRIMTGRAGVEAGLIDDIGGESEALAWFTAKHGTDKDISVHTVWPHPDDSFSILGTLLGSQARAALGLPDGPMMLDGLVSLWQVASGP